MRYVTIVATFFLLTAGAATLTAQKGHATGQANKPQAQAHSTGKPDTPKPATHQPSETKPSGGNPHATTATTTTTTKGKAKATTSTPIVTTTTVTTTTPTTTVVKNPKLDQKMQLLLPTGMNVADAAKGFKNWGQFVAAVHVSRNLNIPFATLKAIMTGTNPMSLGQAIQAGPGPVAGTTTPPTTTTPRTTTTTTTTTTTVVQTEVRKAESQAAEDLRETRNDRRR